MIDLSLHILDVASNAFKANATLLKVTIEEQLDNIQVWIEDNGCGMSEETVKNVSSPFYTSRKTRKVGLGIPLFVQTCEQTGGFLKIQSELNVGTVFHAKMYTNHIDSIPLGDIAESLFVLVINPYNVDVVFNIKFKNSEKEEFTFDTRQIKEVLDGVEITEPSIMSWIKEFITEGLK